MVCEKIQFSTPWNTENKRRVSLYSCLFAIKNFYLLLCVIVHVYISKIKQNYKVHQTDCKNGAETQLRTSLFLILWIFNFKIAVFFSDFAPTFLQVD